MAKKLNVLYPTQSDTDANNLDGTVKNDVIVGDKSGTPFEKEWLRDMWGWLAHLLNQASITPDGSEENQSASQYYQAVAELFVSLVNPVFATDIDFGGNELLNSLTILNQQAGKPYYNFNALTGNLLITDDASFSDGWVNGQTYVCQYNALSVGENDVGRFFEKGGFDFRFLDATGKLRIKVDFSSTNALFNTTNAITLNKNSIVAFSYDGSNVSNEPVMYIDGVNIPITVTQTPVGTITTDVGSDLFIGNVTGDTGTFDGNRFQEMFLNRELTAAELKSITSNPQALIDFADEGGSNILQNVTTFANLGGAPYDTFDGASADGFHAIKTTTGAGAARAFSADEISIVKGQKYVFIFTGTLTSGTAPDIDIVQSVGGSSPLTVEGAVALQAGRNVIEWTGLVTDTGAIRFNNGDAEVVEFTIADADFHKIGTTLRLNGEDFTSNIAYDSSGNGNHAIVSTATLENQPIVGRGEPNNWILNGDHRVNQRGLAGAVATTNGVYDGTDLWQTILNGVTSTVELVTSSQPDILEGSQSLKYIATSTSVGKLGSQQIIEDFSLFKNKTVTIICYIRSNKSENVRLTGVETGVGNFSSSQVHSGGGNWELFSLTKKISNSITGLRVVPRITDITGSGDVSITSGDYIEFTGVSFVFGSQIAPFTPRDLETELRKCQRYFYRAIIGSEGAGGVTENLAAAMVKDADETRAAYSFPVEMRTSPTLAVSNVAHFQILYKADAVSGNGTAMSANQITKRGCAIFLTVDAVLTAGEACIIRSNNASATLDFDAQL